MQYNDLSGEFVCGLSNKRMWAGNGIEYVKIFAICGI